MRCKVNCYYKEVLSNGWNLHFSPVYCGSEENIKYWEATPAGSIILNTVNKAAADEIEQGKDYYLDFSLAKE